MNRIKELRNKAGLSQKEAAQILGVAVRTLQDWESERRTPKDSATDILDACTILTREGINSLLDGTYSVEWALSAKKCRDVKRISKWGNMEMTFHANWDRIPAEVKSKLTAEELAELVDNIKAAYDDGYQKGREKE